VTWTLALLIASQAGVAIGLYPEHPLPGLDEVRALGAEAVSMPVPWQIDDVASDRIAPFEGTIADGELVRMIAAAHGAGTTTATCRSAGPDRATTRRLRVALMPYLVVRDGNDGAWRGVLRPRDRAAWWRAYASFVLHYAAIAQRCGVDTLVLGSELSSMQGESDWEALAKRVRGIYAGRLAYVSNHDALDLTAPFPHVDVAGVSAYFPLTRDLDAPVAELHAAWRKILVDLHRFAQRVDRPLVLFEVGYPSIDGAAVVPWDDTIGAPIDLEEQHRAYDAMTRGLLDAPWLHGTFFWIWYAPGGSLDRGYTVRGKPAEAVVRAYFEAVRARRSRPRPR
jgi:hypothetical protein